MYDREELGLLEDNLIELLTSLSIEELARIAYKRGLTIDHIRNNIGEELIRRLVDISISSQGEEPLETEVSLSLGTPMPD
jgi:hypothetical protein